MNNNYQFYLERVILERSGNIESIDEGMIGDAIDSIKKAIGGMFSGVKEELNDSKKLVKLIHQSYNVLGRDKRKKVEDLLKFASNSKKSTEEKKDALKKIYRVLIVNNPNKEVRTDLIKTLNKLKISTEGPADPFAKLWGIT